MVINDNTVLTAALIPLCGGGQRRARGPRRMVRGLAGSVVTQFGFDPGLVLAWLAGARARGVSLPVRVGVPGPSSVRRLLSYASRCGVSVSMSAARDYGLSLAGPAATATPGRFIRALASGYDARVHGEMKLHLNPFGGFTATAEWASQFHRSFTDPV